MRLIRNALLGAAAAMSLAWVQGASATVLTFDWGGGNVDTVPPNYGTRVGPGGFPIPPGWSYGSGIYGLNTPHVTVNYTPVQRLGSSPNAFDPHRVFGDLSNVLYRDRFDGTPSGILQITLTADVGYLVGLRGFDLASIHDETLNPPTGEDLIVKSIKVLNGLTGTPFYDLEFDAADPNNSRAPAFGHRHFDFSTLNPAPIAQVITIYLDLNQYISTGGSKIDRIGIDNIEFFEIPVPSPGAGVLVVAAAGLLIVRRRRH